MARKKEKVQWRKEGGRLVATLPNSPQDQVKAMRRARREEEIASGVRAGSGSGTHGKVGKALTRHERRKGKQEMRRGNFDD